MTIFPTHKTKLKTALSKQEVLERLERNNIYTIGYYYELKESGTSYALKPVHKDRGRNIWATTVNIKVTEKYPHTFVELKFLPLKSTAICVLIVSLLFLAAATSFALHNILTTGFTFGNLLLIFLGFLFYTIALLMFSSEAISIRKQIEEHIEAESNEIPEEEMSKLQKWYEKERDPFKFRNK